MLAEMVAISIPQAVLKKWARDKKTYPFEQLITNLLHMSSTSCIS